MSKSINKRGDRALFLHRESDGRNDQTPAQYLEWALRRARELGLVLDGSAVRIGAMIRSGVSVDGDIYLDFEVTGNQLDRPALSALFRRIATDQQVSAIFIPRRDRFARPEDPEDGLRLEKIIRRSGVTIHFQDRTLEPLGVRERSDIGELILAAVEYDQAGQFRRELASKMLHAQRNLASQGFSTGGRPPFFLRRWLIDPQDAPIRELAEGEVVRLKYCHVAWLPSNEQSLRLALQIVEMLEQMPASKVIKKLTQMGIPSPDANRTRTDHGVTHLVSGVWNQTTIINVVRGLKLVGKIVYGRRSMGDQLRYSPTGPRELTESDLRTNKKVKVVFNPESEWTQAAAHYGALIDPNRLERLIQDLDRRAGSQRGKPRSHNPDNNPLGTRVFDLACGWPMYRVPYPVRGQKSFRYKCGAYMQSHGARCSHNHVDGPQAARFALEVIRQRLCSPTLIEKVRVRLERLAEKESACEASANFDKQRQVELLGLEEELAAVQRNLARAKSDEQYAVIAEEFEKLQLRKAALAKELAETQRRSDANRRNPQEAVEHALSLLDQLQQLSQKEGDNRLLGELFQATNLRMFLQFAPGRLGKRSVQKLASGVITLGDTPPPIAIYQGKTGRHALKVECGQDNESPHPHQSGAGEDKVTDEDGNSLGNVSRGDRI